MTSRCPGQPQTAVLLLGFGGPESFEEVRPFILNIVRGKGVPPERIEAVVDQYRRIGGRSPFNELTDSQARALSAQLSDHGLPLPVYQGMLCWRPYIADTVNEMLSDSITSAVVIVLSPHRTEASYDRYVKALKEAISATHTEGNGKSLSFEPTSAWHNHPLFIEAITQRVEECWQDLPYSRKRQAKLIFCAHSVPVEMSDASDYAGQVAETAASIVQKLSARHKVNFAYAVAYQSRSGNPRQKWLEPDVVMEIRAAKDQGMEDVIVVPIGFVCDHVEILFDLDVLAFSAAQEVGINMLRAQTVGVHPQFIQLLFELVKARSDAFYAKPDRK